MNNKNSRTNALPGLRRKNGPTSNPSVSDSASRGNIVVPTVKILPKKTNKSQKQLDFEALQRAHNNGVHNQENSKVFSTTKRNINRMVQGNALASLFTGRKTKS